MSPARNDGLRHAAAFALAAAAISCGILDPRPDPTRFYVLHAMAAAPDPAPADDDARASIGIGPVTLPGYLERAELVRRSAPNEVVPSRFERWAEPLAGMTARVLGENLALLTGANVVRYPWLSPAPTSQVVVEIARFEPVDGKRVELFAGIRFVRFDVGTTTEKRHEISVRLSATDADAVAATMSEALLELARRIAADGDGAAGSAGNP